MDQYSDIDEEGIENNKATESFSAIQIPQILPSPDGSNPMVFAVVIRTSKAGSNYFDSDRVAELDRKGRKWGKRLVERAWALAPSSYSLEIYLLNSSARRRPSEWPVKIKVFLEPKYQATTFLHRLKIFSAVIGIGVSALTVLPEGLMELLPPPNPTLPPKPHVLHPTTTFLFSREQGHKKSTIFSAQTLAMFLDSLTQSSSSSLSRILINTPSLATELIQVKDFMKAIELQHEGRQLQSSGSTLLGKERGRHLSGMLLPFSCPEFTSSNILSFLDSESGEDSLSETDKPPKKRPKRPFVECFKDTVLLSLLTFFASAATYRASGFTKSSSQSRRERSTKTIWP